ncbi:MAG TPA: hypothetical protein VF099_15195 [Ktedonobacterales bacterium]
MDYSVKRWEHLIVRLSSATAPHQQFLSQHLPSLVYSYAAPEALIPQLDYYGDQGWELVAIQPVMISQNGEATVAGGGHLPIKTSDYLCTFKRLRQNQTSN